MATLYAVTRPGRVVAGPKEGERGARAPLDRANDSSDERGRKREISGGGREWTEKGSLLGRETYARTRRSIERLRIVLLFNSDRVIDLAVSFSPCREAVRIRVTLRACVRGQLGGRIACKGAANRRERGRRRIRSFNEFDMEGPSLLAIFVIHGTSRLGGSSRSDRSPRVVKSPFDIDLEDDVDDKPRLVRDSFRPRGSPPRPPPRFNFQNDSRPNSPAFAARPIDAASVPSSIRSRNVSAKLTRVEKFPERGVDLFVAGHGDRRNVASLGFYRVSSGTIGISSFKSSLPDDLPLDF